MLQSGGTAFRDSDPLLDMLATCMNQSLLGTMERKWESALPSHVPSQSDIRISDQTSYSEQIREIKANTFHREIGPELIYPERAVNKIMGVFVLCDSVD